MQLYAKSVRAAMCTAGENLFQRHMEKFAIHI